MPTHINSLGLLLDIIGAILLMKFGIPPKVDRQGHIYLITHGVDEDEIRKAKNYDWWSMFGLVLIVLGFVLQLASNYTK